MKLSGVTLFRVTRDAEVELEEDDEDAPLPELVHERVRQRRYEPVVRLEFAEGAEPGLKAMLCERFQLLPLDVYDAAEELDYTSLFEIASMNIPGLRDRPWVPVTPPVFAEDDTDIFTAIRQQDVLVHHPYESFDNTVEHFVAEAARDPNTVAVKMAVYRVGTTPRSCSR